MLKYFFDVPVYRLTEERYYAEMNEYIERNIFPGPPEYDNMQKIFFSREPDQEIGFRHHLRDNFGGAWIYNEIIGYIRLHFLGKQIRGEYWGVKNKRIVKTRKKLFKYRTWKLVSEINVPEEADNKEIFALITEYLSKCSKELKGRYIDIRILNTIGRYIDWKALLADG